MRTMESLIGLVNRIQRACTVLGDYGGKTTAFSSLWVVGGQSSGKSSVLESIVGRERIRYFLFSSVTCTVSGIVTRRPLVLQLHKTADSSPDYAEFLHLPNRRFTDFALALKEIQDETDRVTVLNLTLIDLPGLTKVAVEGQPESIVQDIETVVRSYVEKVNGHLGY